MDLSGETMEENQFAISRHFRLTDSGLTTCYQCYILNLTKQK